MRTDNSLDSRIFVVGCGRAGASMAVTFAHRGFAVSVADRQEARSRLLACRFAVSMRRSGPFDLLVLAVPDPDIGAAAQEWATKGLPPAAVVHLGGATPAEALGPLARLGWRTAKMHPVFAFPAGPAPLPPGVAFGVGAPDAAGLKMARRWVYRLGGRPFSLRPGTDAAWHLACVMAGNLLHAQLQAAGTLMAEAAAMPAGNAMKALAPLVRSSLENAVRGGTAGGLTGPVARGDADAIAAQMAVLSKQNPEYSAFYASGTALLLRLLSPARRAALRRRLRRGGLLL